MSGIPSAVALDIPSAVALRAEHRLGSLRELARPRIYGEVTRVVGLSVSVSGLTGRIGVVLMIGDGSGT